MYICTYDHLYICIYVYVHICIYIYLCIMHICLYAYLHYTVIHVYVRIICELSFMHTSMSISVSPYLYLVYVVFNEYPLRGPE